MATNNNNDGKKSSNKSKWTLPGMGQAMLNLVEPARAPDVITIHYNNTVTRMCRIIDKDSGEIFYTGVPETTTGHKCKFGFTLGCDGYFDGSAAMNFIAAGGWKRGTRKPTGAEKAQAREQFVTSFLSAAIQHRDPSSRPHNFEELKNVVSETSGLKVEEGEMSESELRTLSLMAVPFHIVEVALKRGLRLVTNVPEYIANLVQPAYAKCEEGSWNKESSQVAITSALSTSHTQLMREAGLRFKKVRTYTVAAASGEKGNKTKGQPTVERG